MSLVKEIFLITGTFPNTEIYGLVSQMRRAAVAIPSNIAEGYGRNSTKAYIQFCSIAYGSALELETQLLISLELGFVTSIDYNKLDTLLVEICKMLHALMQKVRVSR